MSQHSAMSSVFDAAKAIFEVLKDLDKQAQLQAIRFASESLGLGAQGPGQMPATLPHAYGTSTPESEGESRSTDIKQFTAAKVPKSDQQFAAVVAYFYRFEAPEAQRRESIDGAVLREAARLVGRKRPTNTNMTLTNAKNAGYLDAVGSGNFRINSVGENLVAVTLPGNGAEVATPRRARRAKVANKGKRGRRKAKRAK